MVELFANSGDPDQTPRSAASDLSLHCLQSTLLGVSRLQWVKHRYIRGRVIQIARCGIILTRFVLKHLVLKSHNCGLSALSS